jgi:hypothetical protein
MHCIYVFGIIVLLQAFIPAIPLDKVHILWPTVFRLTHVALDQRHPYVVGISSLLKLSPSHPRLTHAPASILTDVGRHMVSAKD